ncbi:hypothetical protein ES707_21423 [subsurface metagenome]
MRVRPGTSVSSPEVCLISVSTTGRSMAATVCCPIKDVSSRDITKKPQKIITTRLPVIVRIPSVILESSPCLTIATASMRDPMMKKTASLIYDWATSPGSAITKVTCRTAIKRAIAGRGTASLRMRMITITQMMSVR